jgi:hypothetical protein
MVDKELPDETLSPPGFDSTPPGLTVVSGDGSVLAGLGTFCYGNVCADAIGHITRKEPLLLQGGSIVGTLAFEEVAEVSVTASPASTLVSEPICTDSTGPLCDEGGPLLAWTGYGVEEPSLSAMASGQVIEVDASALAPDTYVVDFFVRFVAGGDASYGLLLDVAEE